MNESVSSVAGQSLNKAIVIFDTRYGNTGKVARSLASGLNEAGVGTVCVNLRDVDLGALRNFTLICIGSPTEYFTASRSMRSFLSAFKADRLKGKYGFAFDSRFESRMSGSASRFIERSLRRAGAAIIMTSEKALVRGEIGKPDRMVLLLGEEERFRTIGTRLGMLVQEKIMVEQSVIA